MICEKCGKEFFEDWREVSSKRKNPIPRFCCRKCSNSRKVSSETKEKISSSVKEWSITHPDERKKLCEREDIREKIIAASKQWQKKRREALFSAEFETLSFDLKRKRIILEQENKCNLCGLSEWMEKTLILEIDHKDGNNKNNDRNNLVGLCPNCHSTTPTWRGRNLLKIKVTDEEIIKAFYETDNIRQCLLKVGLVPKGYNYQRVKKIIANLDIISSN